MIKILTLIIVWLLLLSCDNSGGGKTELAWKSPADNEHVYGIVKLAVEATGSSGSINVNFYCDSVNEENLIATASGSNDTVITADWYTSEVKNSEHNLYAVINYAEGDSLQKSIRVYVENLSRADAIPADGVKVTPDTDQHHPILNSAFSDIWEDPVPMDGPINTAGGEDSPFITPDGKTFFFWFTPDVSRSAYDQVGDRVTGIYWSKKNNGEWSEPERIFLNYFDEPSLEGAHTVRGNTMWFASARAGNYRDIDMWTAQLEGERWTSWTNAGEKLNLEYEIGELHVTADGSEIYFDSKREGGMGEKDIWVTARVDGQWQEPVNVTAVNTEGTDGWPFISEDGNELWFTRAYTGAPSIYRAQRFDGQWQEPELILDSFAGEPSLDNGGNIYFVHHFWDDKTNSMIEADYYVCYRK
jgi:hypothetical protein